MINVSNFRPKILEHCQTIGSFTVGIIQKVLRIVKKGSWQIKNLNWARSIAELCLQRGTCKAEWNTSFAKERRWRISTSCCSSNNELASKYRIEKCLYTAQKSHNWFVEASDSYNATRKIKTKLKSCSNWVHWRSESKIQPNKANSRIRKTYHNWRWCDKKRSLLK